VERDVGGVGIDRCLPCPWRPEHAQDHRLADLALDFADEYALKRVAIDGAVDGGLEPDFSRPLRRLKADQLQLTAGGHEPGAPGPGDQKQAGDQRWSD